MYIIGATIPTKKGEVFMEIGEFIELFLQADEETKNQIEEVLAEPQPQIELEELLSYTDHTIPLLF